MINSITEIRFINEDGEHKVAVVEEGMTAGDVISRLFVPAMLSAGFAYSTVTKAIEQYAE